MSSHVNVVSCKSHVYSTEPRDEARFMKTPLLVAISLQNLQMVRLLIQSGADCNTGVGPLGLPIHKVCNRKENAIELFRMIQC